MVVPKPDAVERLKKQVISRIFALCQERGNFVFDNTLVKQVALELKFGNPFDATKIDNKSLLPQVLRDNDYALIHLGNGRHQFVPGIDRFFHSFEPVTEVIDWPYRRSLLNDYNTSESNVLSVANNQRILHHFLFKQDKEFDSADISERPKTYFPHRTKATFSYCFGDVEINLSNVQIEIDLTLEYHGTIGVFEAKNGLTDSFAVCQLYNPFRYYHDAKARPALQNKIKEIVGIYVVREARRSSQPTFIKMWAYTFDDPLDMGSIRLLRCAAYRLIAPQAEKDANV